MYYVLFLVLPGESRCKSGCIDASPSVHLASRRDGGDHLGAAGGNNKKGARSGESHLHSERGRKWSWGWICFNVVVVVVVVAELSAYDGSRAHGDTATQL